MPSLAAHPRPHAVSLDDAGAVEAAPEHAIVSLDTLGTYARLSAAVVVCQAHTCRPCIGHMSSPDLATGDRIVIGRRGTPRAVYRVTEVLRLGWRRLEREA